MFKSNFTKNKEFDLKNNKRSLIIINDESYNLDLSLISTGHLMFGHAAKIIIYKEEEAISSSIISEKKPIDDKSYNSDLSLIGIVLVKI